MCHMNSKCLAGIFIHHGLNQTGFIGDQKAWKIDHDPRNFWEPFFPKKYGPAQCG